MPYSKRHLEQTFLALMAMLPIVCSSCRDDGERQETVTKLRALGVSQSPVNAKPGETVELTYFLAAPPSANITALPAVDDNARYSLPVIATPIDSGVTETNYGALSLYSYKANIVIPSGSAITVPLNLRGFARVRSNIEFSTGNGDSEDIVSDTIVYGDGSPQLNWTAPTVDIIKPSASAAAGKLEVEGSIASSGNETHRIAWFVSSGKIKNRRAKVSTWEDASTGSQTLFFTVRGSKSGVFGIKAINVNLSGG